MAASSPSTASSLSASMASTPATEKGQTKYPRYEFFQEIFKVFRASGRSCPRIQRQASFLELGMGEGDLRHCPRTGLCLHGGLELACDMANSIARDARRSARQRGDVRLLRRSRQLRLSRTGNTSMHGRAAQRRRNRRSSGCRRIAETTSGRPIKKAFGHSDLCEAALCRSHTLTPAREGFNDILPTMEDMQRLVKNPVAYRYEHNDGLKSTMLLMSGLVKDFNFAARLDNGLFSTQMYLPMPDGRTTLANFFSPLVNDMEQMFLTGKPTYPVERTLLTTGLTAAGVDSLFTTARNGSRLRTWRSNISRRVNRRSGEVR